MKYFNFCRILTLGRSTDNKNTVFTLSIRADRSEQTIKKQHRRRIYFDSLPLYPLVLDNRQKVK